MFQPALLSAIVLALALPSLGSADSTQTTPAKTLTALLPSLAPADRANVVYVDSQCGTASIPTRLAQDLWQAPNASEHCYVHPTGEKFTLRKVAGRPLLFAPSQGSSPADVLAQFETEFGSNSGPYRRVLTRLPTRTKPGFSWMSARVHLPGEIDVAELDDDTACIYCGGWGGHRGAVDAGFVHSRARHDWAFFIRREVTVTDSSQPTGETFSFKTRFKENQDVKLTFSVPTHDRVAVTATGLDERDNSITRTVIVALDHQFAWRADGKANILKRIVTIAQDKEDFSKNEKVIGVHWFSPTSDSGPCRIGWNWRNNHDWGAGDSIQEQKLGSYETWPASYRGHKIVFVEAAGPGEETDGIQLLGAQHTIPAPVKRAGGSQ